MPTPPTRALENELRADRVPRSGGDEWWPASVRGVTAGDERRLPPPAARLRDEVPVRGDIAEKTAGA